MTKTFVLKTGPVLLRNIIGPVFNTTSDQLLTQHFLFCLFFLACFLAETPTLMVFQQNMQSLKQHKKETKTLFVSTPVLTALVKMSVF